MGKVYQVNNRVSNVVLCMLSQLIPAAKAETRWNQGMYGMLVFRNDTHWAADFRIHVCCFTRSCWCRFNATSPLLSSCLRPLRHHHCTLDLSHPSLSHFCAFQIEYVFSGKGERNLPGCPVERLNIPTTKEGERLYLDPSFFNGYVSGVVASNDGPARILELDFRVPPQSMNLDLEYTIDG